MATIVTEKAPPVGFRRAAGVPEYTASALAIVLIVAVVGALWNGRNELGRLPLEIAIHLVTIVPALAMTPWMLLAQKGDTLHRRLGWTWCILMVITAFSAIFIRTINDGFSVIHIFVVVTLVGVPRLIVNARRHRVAAHRYSVLGMVFGAFLIAGAFAFVGNRHLGNWLFG